MKREIKFRVWDKAQKVMMVPRDVQTDSDGNVFYIEANSPTGEYDEGDLDVFKLEQFTGMKDANGNDIYENDLVLLDPDDQLYQVIFDEGKFEIVGDGIVYDLGEEFMNCEIFGNVHANPELMEADK